MVEVKVRFCRPQVKSEPALYTVEPEVCVPMPDWCGRQLLNTSPCSDDVTRRALYSRRTACHHRTYEWGDRVYFGM